MSRVPSGLPSSTMMISQFRLLSFVFSLVMGLRGWGEGGDGEGVYFSRKVRSRSQTMIGRFLRSL